MGHSVKKSTKLVHLSTAQMQRLAKPRKGFEPFAQRLAALVENNAKVRAMSEVDTRAMLDELAEYEAVHGAAMAARDQLAMAEQTELLHGSNVWTGMLKIYRYAKTLAADDPALAALIADFEAFMSSPRRKPKTTPTAA